MLAAAVAVRPHGDDDVRPFATQRRDEIREHPLLAPRLHRLLDGEGVAEIHGAQEALFAAVDASRAEKFTGADQGQITPKFGADFVLAAFPARGGAHDDARSEAARQRRDEAVVLVVGVREHDQSGRGSARATQGEFDGDVAVFGRRRHPELRRAGCGADDEGRCAQACVTQKPRNGAAEHRTQNPSSLTRAGAGITDSRHHRM